MKNYIIDGNNLIGKINSLKNIQQKDKQSAREKLIFFLDNYFLNKNTKLYLHFDGFENTPLSLIKGKIIYSEKFPADKKIKEQIENTKNRKSLVVISSDHEIQNFSRVCSCEVLSCEEFLKELTSKKDNDDEQKRIEDLKKNSTEEFKKLFGAD